MQEFEPRTVDPGIPLWVKVPLVVISAIVLPLMLVLLPYLAFHLFGSVGLWSVIALEVMMATYFLFASFTARGRRVHAAYVRSTQFEEPLDFREPFWRRLMP